MRIAYQYHHLSEQAKKTAESNNKGKLLSQFLYNHDGTVFECSTHVCIADSNPSLKLARHVNY